MRSTRWLVVLLRTFLKIFMNNIIKCVVPRISEEKRLGLENKRAQMERICILVLQNRFVRVLP